MHCRSVDDFCKCCSGPQVKSSSVFLRCFGQALVVYPEVSESLVASVCSSVGRLVRNESSVHYFLCLGILSFEQKCTDVLEAFSCIRVCIVHLAAAPHRDLIEDDPFTADATVRHHAKSAVAQREGLLPYFCRLVVP